MILIHLSRATDWWGEVCKNLASGRSFVQGRREATFGIEQAHGQWSALASMKAETPVAVAL